MFSLGPEIIDKLTVVWWADASQSGEWKFADELERILPEKLTIINSVGFLIWEDEEKVVLAAAMCPEQEGSSVTPQCGSRMTIPKSAIRKRIEIDMRVYQ